MPMNSPNTVFRDVILKCQLGKPFNDGLFKKSWFAYFLELSEARPLCFLMIMVYSLFKRRIKYVGDDEGLKEGRKNMDEVWINYCGMPVCFKLKEFAIVTLRYDRPEEPLIKEIPHKVSNKRKVKKDGLLDVRKVIEDDLLALADDFGKFNDHPWGYDSYFLTIKYLLKKLKPKTTKLYGFPWAFMSWMGCASLDRANH
ncbi:hypothetical protein P3S68_003943 [Capsicum galapagoense]